MNARTLIAVDPDTLDNIMKRLDRIDRRFDTVQLVKSPEWLTVPQYAAKMGRTKRTVRNWIDAGKVETKVEGNALLVRISPDV